MSANGKHTPAASAPAARGSSPVAGPADLLIGSPGLGADAALALLVRLAPLRWVSLWGRDGAGEVRCVSSAGEPSSSRGARELAGQLLAGAKPIHGQRRQLLGTPLRGHEGVFGVLLGRAHAGAQERCRALLSEVAPILQVTLERDIRSAERAACQHALLATAERKLTRLGLDLHDGPIQDLAALASDLRLFADQLPLVVTDGAQRDVLRGRVEDLEAQLLALDRGLRRISSEVQPGQGGRRGELRVALSDLVHSFAERTGVKPRLSLAGSLGALSDSQQIALLNIVAEALSNIRRHADASSVRVAVQARREGVEATIIDDGRGFEMRLRPKRAASEGRKGLLAIKERVRLLGGRCVIESQPGGPTCVRVMLPRWGPVRARRGRQAAAPTARNGASSFSNA
jgi:signal transduction histidine kinase